MATTLHEFRKQSKKERKRTHDESQTWMENDTLRNMNSVGTNIEMDKSSSDSNRMKVALRNFESYGRNLELTASEMQMRQLPEKNLSLPEVHNTDRPTTFGMRHGSVGDI